MTNHKSNQRESSPTKLDKSFFIVGIGASAGGLHALEDFFDNMSADSGAAFVVIQHLSPDFKSLMQELLQRRTSMVVQRVTDGMELEPNSVYLIPPGKNLIVENSVLRLSKREEKSHSGVNFPIDLFLESLATNYAERAIGVILSGSGSDGAHGLRRISEAGGVALVQEPTTAEFDGMPRSALATGVVNQVLPPRELAQLIYEYTLQPLNNPEINLDPNQLLDSTKFKQILEVILAEEGLDFSHYKPTTLSRRIHRRCLINKCRSIKDYLHSLQTSSEERRVLCADLLISVTNFFRDETAWEHLENNVIPLLIEQSQPQEELRFWVTACATGEEAYSLAILLDEALTDCNKQLKVKIFATDLDRVALEKASQGIYPATIANHVTPERLRKYFVTKEDGFEVVRKIREMLIFAPHDLTKDAGFTKMHLITCRNVLIYMQPSLQYQVLRNLHFSLVPKGILFLGEAETLGEFEEEFIPLDKKWKIYQKRRNIRLPLPVQGINKIRPISPLQNISQSQVQSRREPRLEKALTVLLQQQKATCLLVDNKYDAIELFDDLAGVLQLPKGQLTKEVVKLVIPPLQLPLNAALRRAKKENQSVLYTNIRLDDSATPRHVTLKVDFYQDNKLAGDFFLVTIQEEKTVAMPKMEGEQFEVASEAQRRIFELEYELQQTRENLQALVEELETTNEEQQASNEELIASNEELQSTNEELHSVNEELHTVNSEYQSKIQELIELNNDIDNLLTSTEIGVIFLDKELKIRKFTPAAKKAINLRDTDINRPLEELSYKIDYPNLIELLQSVITKEEPLELEVKLKHSQSFLLMRVNLYQLDNDNYDGIVISFVELDEIKKVQKQLEETLAELENREQQLGQLNQELEQRVEERTTELVQLNKNLQQEIAERRQIQARFKAIFQSITDALVFADPEREIKMVNPAFERLFGYSPEAVMDRCTQMLYANPDEYDAQGKACFNPQAEGVHDCACEISYLRQDGSTFISETVGSKILDEAGNLLGYVGLIRDISDRKRVESLLQRQLKAIEASLDGIAILHDNKYIYLNQSHLDIFGYSHPEELLGQSWQIMYEREQIAFLEAEVFPLLQQYGYWRGETKAKHRHGHTFYEELSLTLSEQGDLICVCRDISERKQAEQALRESEQRYRYVYNNTPAMLHSIDRTGKLISVSNYWLEHLGYEREEVIGRKSTEFLTEESRHYAQEVILTEFFQTGICTDIPYQIICKNGEIRDVLLSAIAERDRSGEIIHSLAVMVDVTELKQTEAALRESEARFRMMADSVPIMIWMSGVDGLGTYLNPCWLDFTGRSLEQDLGNGWTEIIHPQDRQDAFKTYMSAFEARQTFQMQYRLRRADGEYRWLLSTGIPRFNPDGNFAGYIGSCADITEIKQAKEQLSQANIELEQRVAQRTAELTIAKEAAEAANQSKNSFIAHMNHELRTPLNGILGFTQILQKDPHLTSQQNQNLNLIHRSGQHLLELINDILNFSKIEADKIQLEEQDFNLLDFLDNLAAISHLRAEQKNIDFCYRLLSSLPQIVKADETRLRQVLLNLLGNAIKFTDRGEVTFQVGYLEDFELEVKGDKGDGEDREDEGDGGEIFQTSINHQLSTINHYKIRFWIKDTGIGISGNKLADIFLPFEQVHEAQSDREGTGLGLTISQKLIQLMGSQIQVTSTVGEGSIFWFDLDLPEGDPANVSTPNFQFAIEPTGFHGRSRKILVVDDIIDNRQLLIQHLQPLGFELAEAENGKQGLAIAETFKPDVILLDALMPEIDGLEMLKQLRQHPQLKDITVIFVSANSQFAEQLKTSQLKFEGFLSKPIDYNQLLESLQTHLQLQWIFLESEQKSDLASLVAPPQDKLLELWELAQIGDIEELSEQINSLEKLESQYLPFVNKIRKLVKSCEVNQLIKLLEYVRENP